MRATFSSRERWRRKAEVEWLVKRVEEQVARSEGVLPKAAVEEYREALKENPGHRGAKRELERLKAA